MIVESQQRSDASLRLESLRKDYGDVRAVADVSLDVAPGEFLTLLGASGSGKTTILNLVAGFIEPTAGQIHYGGQLLNGVPPYKRDIGVVFQNYALFPHMRVKQNVAFPLKRRGTPRHKIDRMVAEALELVELGGYEERLPRELSGGQQQRVALARAIVYRPQLLLLDEPLGALDRRLRESLQEQLREIHRELGITFILVTHDQSEAMALSDRVVILRSGQIEQIGAPTDLYYRPMSPYVVEFMGDANYFNGHVTRNEGDGSVWLTTEDGGGSLQLHHVAEVGDGDEASVAIRPEKVQIVPAKGEDSLGDQNGVVSSVTFLGSQLRVEVETNGLGRVNAVVPSGIDGAAGLKEGMRVKVGWRPEDLIALDL